MSGVFDWKLANPELALTTLSSEPLGSASIDHKPLELGLASNLSFDGDGRGRLILNVRGALSVTVLNDPADPDEDGIVSVSPARTAAGILPPQLTLDPHRAYVKFRAAAGVKARGGLPIGELIGLDAAAEASAIFADYRLHPREAQVRETILRDTLTARFVTRLEDVLELPEGEALGLRFNGTLDVALTVRWSDIFTGQIGTLGTRLGAAVPIAISAKTGVTLALNVRVADEFMIVFSRVGSDRWRAGVRKVKSSRLAPSLDAGIDVGIADPKPLVALATSALEGVLGAPLNRIEQLLGAASLDALAPPDRKLALLLLERLGLDEGVATIEELRDRVAAVRTRTGEVIEQVVRTRVALGFAYEYNRTGVDTNLLQATMDRAAVAEFHAQLIKGSTERLAGAVRDGRGGVELETYLNEKEVTRARSYGFTLGFGKWASVGGRDFRKIATVRRRDIQGRVQESYLGARSYTGQWTGEKAEWGVDLKADMKDYAAEPLVSDYSFGIHLFWSAAQANLSGTELEEWLDAAIVWRVLRESDLVSVRADAAAALGSAAECRVHLTIPNTVVRSILPLLAAAPVEAYAPALAAAMPWMRISPARTAPSLRRQVYAPLWSEYLQQPARPQALFAEAAAAHVREQGYPELVLRETAGRRGPDPFSFAGLTHINGNTRRACEAFTRGALVLQTAIASGAHNHRTIDRAVAEMDDLWRQSHHVRAMGVRLLDVAEQAGVLDGVTRTLAVEARALGNTLIVTA